MQWQTYIERYPGTILAAAALLGVAVGRRLARGLAGNGHPDAEGDWTSGPSAAASMARVPARLEGDARGGAAVAAASLQRLGSRVEGLVNRMIDDVADAVERALVPALVGGVEALLEGRAARSSYRPAPPERGEGSRT
jgi:hypothetical protein